MIYMIDFKCTICKDYTEVVEIVRKRKDPNTGKDLYEEIRRCDGCNVGFEINEDIISVMTFVCTIREQKYYWSLVYGRGQSEIWDGNYKIIQKFNFIPTDLTPKNIKEKLTTYLTFL